MYNNFPTHLCADGFLSFEPTSVLSGPLFRSVIRYSLGSTTQNTCAARTLRGAPRFAEVKIDLTI